LSIKLLILLYFKMVIIYFISLVLYGKILYFIDNNLKIVNNTDLIDCTVQFPASPFWRGRWLGNENIKIVLKHCIIVIRRDLSPNPYKLNLWNAPLIPFDNRTLYVCFHIRPIHKHWIIFPFPTLQIRDNRYSIILRS